MEHVPEIEFEEPLAVAEARGWLEHVRSARNPRSAYLVSNRVTAIYGDWRFPLATERDMVEYLLAFANRETDHTRYSEAIRSGHHSIKRLSSKGHLPLTDQLQFIATAIEARRKILIVTLDSIVEGGFSPSSDFSRGAARALSRAWTLPRLDASANNMALGEDTLLLHPDTFETYALMFILDPSRTARPGKTGRSATSFGEDLRRCLHCKKFFLVPLGLKGRPPKAYCPGTDCGTVHHDEKAPERMATRRRKKASKHK